MAHSDDSERREGSGKKYMKMKELSALTGVNGPTIRYYINQGILPKPYKTHKNMSYYDESYAALINLIKKFQKEYFLPLEVIKNAIDELGHDKVPYMINELTQKLLQAKKISNVEPVKINKHAKSVSEKELMDVSKISKKDMDDLVKLGILIQDDNACFSAHDVKIAMLIAEIRDKLSDEKGFSIDFIGMHNDYVKDIVDKEFKYFVARILKGTMDANDADDLAFKCLEVLYRLLPILHKRYLAMKIKDSLYSV